MDSHPTRQRRWLATIDTPSDAVKLVHLGTAERPPTVTLRFPSNIPNMPGHNWANAISMATPIAHKGVVAGAKAQAMTMLDILLTPQIVTDAWDYFTNVQTKTIKYRPFFAATDQPPIWLNEATMAKYRPEMRKFYYDPKKYDTYLKQLGIEYPTVRKIVP